MLITLSLLDTPYLRCPVRLCIGRLCPTCGTTHAVSRILVGHFREAWNYNPIGFVVVLAFGRRLAQPFSEGLVGKLVRSQYLEFVLLTAFFALGIARFLGWM